MAAAQALAMANSWRMRGRRSGSAPAGESFLRWTECPLRSLRQRLVLANYWRRWPRVHLSKVGIEFFDVAHPFPSHLPQAIGLLLINALGIFASLPHSFGFSWRGAKYGRHRKESQWRGSDSVVDDFWHGWTLARRIMRTNSYIARSCGLTGWWARLLQGACFLSSQTSSATVDPRRHRR